MAHCRGLLAPRHGGQTPVPQGVAATVRALIFSGDDSFQPPLTLLTNNTGAATKHKTGFKIHSSRVRRLTTAGFLQASLSKLPSSLFLLSPPAYRFGSSD